MNGTTVLSQLSHTDVKIQTNSKGSLKVDN